MELNKYKVKDSNEERQVSSLIKTVGGIRKFFGTIIFLCSLGYVVDSFSKNGFWYGFLSLFLGLIVWRVLDFFLSIIFYPLFSYALKKDFGIDTGIQIPKVTFNKGLINPSVVVIGLFSVIIVIMNYMNSTNSVSGRYASFYIQQQFNKTILLIIIIIGIVAVVLFFNRTKK